MSLRSGENMKIPIKPNEIISEPKTAYLLLSPRVK